MRRLWCCVALATVLVTSVGCGGPEDADEPVNPERKLELSRNRHSGVYLGVSCPQPNMVTCDRVGLAAWLAQPAKRLTAEVEGRPLTLERDQEWAVPRETPWVGYLQPAGLLDPGGPLSVAGEPGQPADYWSGVTPVEVTIRLTAGYADGSTARTTIRAPLHPGWG